MVAHHRRDNIDPNCGLYNLPILSAKHPPVQITWETPAASIALIAFCGIWDTWY